MTAESDLQGQLLERNGDTLLGRSIEMMVKDLQLVPDPIARACGGLEGRHQSSTDGPEHASRDACLVIERLAREWVVKGGLRLTHV